MLALVYNVTIAVDDAAGILSALESSPDRVISDLMTRKKERKNGFVAPKYRLAALTAIFLSRSLR